MDTWESEDRTHYDACRDLGVLAEFCPPDAELKSKKGKPAQRQLKRERRAHNDELIKKARLEAAQAAVPDGVGGSNLQVRSRAAARHPARGARPRCNPCVAVAPSHKNTKVFDSSMLVTTSAKMRTTHTCKENGEN